MCLLSAVIVCDPLFVTCSLTRRFSLDPRSSQRVRSVGRCAGRHTPTLIPLSSPALSHPLSSLLPPDFLSSTSTNDLARRDTNLGPISPPSFLRSSTPCAPYNRLYYNSRYRYRPRRFYFLKVNLAIKMHASFALALFVLTPLVPAHGFIKDVTINGEWRPCPYGQ